MDACPTARPVPRDGAVSGLTPTRAAIEALGVRLRDLRRDAALTGRQLARQCGWQPSKVSKLEYGKQTPTESEKRPEARTALKNLLLAGDWTATGLPATIEGAIRSGNKAADLLLLSGSAETPSRDEMRASQRSSLDISQQA